MKDIVILHSDEHLEYKQAFYDQLLDLLKLDGFATTRVNSLEDAILLVKNNARIAAVVFDWDEFQLDLLQGIEDINENLPLLAISEQHEPLDLTIHDFELNIEFLSYRFETVEEINQRIQHHVNNYINNIMPPFTRALFNYALEGKYTFCTPGHLGGTAFLKSPVGSIFYDFYGENTFKADLSISVDELGSLLDHTGPHKDAEILAAKTFGADKTLFVTNGTSTSNKIVGMYSATGGDVVLIDRNCHKSLTHLLMMIDVIPIYLKPTRNAHGILGGIPQAEFSEESIKAKLKERNVQNLFPTYGVITNSTYDGLFYNVETIKHSLPVKHLHFDSAWVPYTNFQPAYKGKFGMHGEAPKGKTIFETQSTHKLLAAFSQASMIHVKGEYTEQVLNECYMMHTSTSPQYSIVASCDVATGMMRGKGGFRLIDEAIKEAINFRQEIQRLNKEFDTWFYDLWQPDDISEETCWPLNPMDDWHGFKDIDDDHMYLDPIKVTVTTPGIENNEIIATGIPAPIINRFLDEKGIVVEKTGPYCLLFLFSMGIDRAKSMQLLYALTEFKRDYDKNLFVKDMIPSLYHEHPDFYKSMTIQTLAHDYHQILYKNNFSKLMYNAFEALPEMEITPHQAYKELIKGDIEKVPLDNLKGRTSAVMILPYPPGIPLIMPGEKITEESEDVLKYLTMLEVIGQKLPGFGSDIHGVEVGDNNELLVSVLV